MGVFVRAVVTGFGFSLGTALFKRVQKQMGFSDEKADVQPAPEAVDDADESDDADDTGDAGEADSAAPASDPTR